VHVSLSPAYLSRYWTVGGYIVFFIIGTVTIPHIYSPAKWYYCATAYAIAPFMAVANAYIAGLTDQVSF
jgi:OPT oligopeptide transporter protein